MNDTNHGETMSPAESAVLVCRDLHKSYRQGPETVSVLRGVNLSVERGERVAIVGQSGSGKTTLLNMLGGLDQPSQGDVLIGGESIAAVSEKRRCTIRNRTLGFVYQFHHLMGEFSALENAAMPLRISGVGRQKAHQSAGRLLEQVGLGHRLDHRPAELSGGERQRVAIARALVNNPACVLMDEPTGNLDNETAESIQSLLSELNRTLSTAMILVTHDLNLARRMDRVMSLQGGRLEAHCE